MSNIKNKETRKLIRKMHKEGWSNRAIGRELGVPESSIRYFLKQQGELQYEHEDVAFKRETHSSVFDNSSFYDKEGAFIGYGNTEIVQKVVDEVRPKIKLTVNPKPDDYFMEKFVGSVLHDNSRILLISDLHIPYHHPDALDFLQHLKDKYNPTRVICMGDELDKHSLSFHDSDPDLPSAGDELRASLPVIQKLKEMFPVMDILESNHGSLLYRKAHAFGIPKHYLKSYNDVLGVDSDWKWYYDITVDLPNGNKCYLHHGKSSNVTKTSQTMSMCSAAGHFHETFKIEYWGNPVALYWAMQTGCLIDDKSYAFNYNNVNLKRPIIGTGLIINSMPILEPMVLDKNGRWVDRKKV